MTTRFLFHAFSKFGSLNGGRSFGEDLGEFIKDELGWEANVISMTQHNVRLCEVVSKDGVVYRFDEISLEVFKELPAELKEALEKYRKRYWSRGKTHKRR